MRIPIPYIVIGVLIIVIVVMRSCSNGIEKKYLPVVTVVTKVIAVPYNKYYARPYPVVRIDSFERPQVVDTSRVLTDYYVANVYDRVIMDDSNGKLTLRDTVTQNKLRTYKLSGEVLRHEKIITNTIIQPLRNRVYMGLSMPVNMNMISIVPMVTLLTKKDNTLYSIGYDPFSKVGYIGMQFKIKK